MEPLEQPTGRRARLALVAVALFALLAIVAFASRSGLGHNSNAGPTPGYLSYAYSAFLILFVLAIPVALWALWLEKARIAAERPTFRRVVIQNLLTFGILLALIFGALYLKTHHIFLHRHTSDAIQNARNAITKGRLKPKSADPTFEWPVFWIALGLIAIVSVPVVRSYRRERARRRARALRAPIGVAEDLAATMSDAIDDLEAEPDARRAVIAAYARMEGVFARHGLRRTPSETPMEYLRRILLGLTARADAVSDLTTLFEQAKFSSHEIDGSMKQDAIGALREIRDDLRAAPA